VRIGIAPGEAGEDDDVMSAADNEPGRISGAAARAGVIGYANPAHATDVGLVARALGVDPSLGLSDEEAGRRLRENGPNILPSTGGRNLTQMLREQILNVVVLLLVAAAIISYATGEALQAAAIIVVLVLNAVVGVVTEWQSGRALDALRQAVHTRAAVRRDGSPRELDAEVLVRGDVVLLAAGDRVPADLRVIEAAALRAEESSLTGESSPVEKSIEAVEAEARVVERRSMLFLGSMIAAGRGVGLVVATGAQTELGRIGRLVSEIDLQPTALQKRLQQLGHRLVYLVLAIGGIVTIGGWLRGEPFWGMVEVGLSLAVAAVPEALPAVTTFILAFGVLRMARRNAIVRRLSAVETLGSTTVICSDKTGTLTLNQMTVVELRLPDGARVDPRSVSDAGAWQELATIAALCNDATSQHGDPTESALVTAAERLGIDVGALRAARPRVAEEPFQASTRRMITVHRDGQGTLRAMKGAPSVVLDACNLPAEERRPLEAMNTEMAQRGLRVLALAAGRTRTTNDREGPYSFAGFAGLIDPPRPGVPEAIAAARAAGIRIVMLTGDQIDTARSIARELGIGDRVLHARAIDQARPEDLPALVEKTDAFARVSPEEKYRIVEALQRSGEIVAVTGDGVNDAPALKKADVGVAMGGRGTEVAKEAADIVLSDDNFATIVAAIEGGRTIYANIVKFVHMMFSHNLSEVLTIFVALLLGWPLPLIPLQILWLNMATDVFPGFALALEPASAGAMRRPPRSPRAPLFSSALITLIVWQGGLLAAVSLTIYRWALHEYGPGTHARTVALLALVGVQIGHTFNCRSRLRSAFDGLFTNPHVWFAAATVVGMQVLLFASPPLMRIIGVVRPTIPDLLAIAVSVIIPVVLVEAWKWVARGRHQR
jgi:Ca2+-transporting ATPase